MYSVICLIIPFWLCSEALKYDINMKDKEKHDATAAMEAAHKKQWAW